MGALGELQVSVNVRMNCTVPKKKKIKENKSIFSIVKAGSVDM